jgi:hypothetical protein
MKNGPTVSVPLKVGGQTFRVRIPPEEKDFYERTAKFTEETYQEIAGQTVAGGAQVWAMTAFQLASELLECRRELGSLEDHRERIDRLIQRIEKSAPSR